MSSRGASVQPTYARDDALHARCALHALYAVYAMHAFCAQHAFRALRALYALHACMPEYVAYKLP